MTDSAAPTYPVETFDFDAVPPNFIVVDLEASCWERNPPFPHEVIEIGAVASVRGQGTVDEFQTFVRPRLAPVLSEFCTELTHITQADVAQAPAFPEALHNFVTWAAHYQPYVLASWGNYDRQQFIADCRLHELPYPFDAHLNLKLLFADRMKCRPCGMKQGLRKAGLPLEGTHHRGIDDARNITRLLKVLMGLRSAGD